MTRALLVCFALLLLAAPLTACGDTGITPRADRDSDSSERRPRGDPPGPPWGGAIMGIRIGIDPAKRVFAQGEDLIITVRAENVLSKPLKLPRFADGAWGCKLLISGKEGDYTSTRGVDNSSTNDYVIQPGEVWSKQINISREATIKKSGGGAVTSLPPGLYEIFGGYTNHKGAGYWVGGHCWSNGVTITVE